MWVNAPPCLTVMLVEPVRAARSGRIVASAGRAAGTIAAANASVSDATIATVLVTWRDGMTNDGMTDMLPSPKVAVRVVPTRELSSPGSEKDATRLWRSLRTSFGCQIRVVPVKAGPAQQTA